MSERINFAIIGCGHIGQRHAAMILKNQAAALVAMCDVAPKSNIKGIDTFQDVPFFEDIDELLIADLNIDVVCICSPNGLHESQALKALNAGKHIVIEKPMALTKASCEKIIFKALQKHKQVFCVMQNRYSPPAIWFKNVVEAKLLGKIYMVQINCYWNRDDRYYQPDPITGKPTGWHGRKDLDGGTLFTQFSHFIDLMYWYFGDITNIQSRLKDFKHETVTDFEDSGFVTFDFIEGGMGSFNYSTAVWDKNLESSITIIAENGAVKMSGQYMEKVTYCHIKDYIMPALAPKTTAQNHHFVIENVVNVLQGKAMIDTNALEGLKVVEIIERMYNQN
jgi:predicted dehydrogenase